MIFDMKFTSNLSHITGTYLMLLDQEIIRGDVFKGKIAKIWYFGLKFSTEILGSKVNCHKSNFRCQ